MKSALLHEQDGARTFLIVFENEDEAMTTLASFVTTVRRSSSFSSNHVGTWSVDSIRPRASH